MEHKKSVCPSCRKEITTFKDNLSLKEFTISGLCQECQDKTFNKQAEIPTIVLSEQAIQEFKELYLKECGTSLTNEQALDYGSRLVKLIMAVYGNELPKKFIDNAEDKNNN